MNADRANLNRWAVSIGLASLLHGAIAVAILNWHNSISSIKPSAPFLIDLLPLPDGSGPQQSAFKTLAFEGVGAPPPTGQGIANAPTPEPIDPAKATAAEKMAASGEGNAPPPAGPANMTAATAAPAALAPAKDAEQEDSAQARTAGGGGAVGASHAISSNGRGGSSAEGAPAPPSAMDTPLDTSITVMPGLYGKKAGGGTARQKKNIVLLRPSKHSVALQHPRNVGPAESTMRATNPVGAHVEDRVKAALARANGNATTKNAIGTAAAPGMVGGGNAHAAEGVTTNAIGMTVPVHPVVPGANAGETKGAPNVAASTAMNRPVINGRDMIRPGTATGVIGGPARNAVGVLNGTNFHIRQP